jgi:hypothetical protein
MAGFGGDDDAGGCARAGARRTIDESAGVSREFSKTWAGAQALGLAARSFSPWPPANTHHPHLQPRTNPPYHTL